MTFQSRNSIVHTVTVTHSRISGLRMKTLLLFLLTATKATNATLGSGCEFNSECNNENEICSYEASQCVCEEGYKPSSSSFKCILPTYGDACVDKCDDPYICDSNICGCSTSQFYDESDRQCENKKAYNSSCTQEHTGECQESLVCLNGQCSCLSYQYLSTTPGEAQCQPTKNYGEVCSNIDKECGYFVCLDNQCSCPRGMVYSHERYSCYILYEHGEPCQSSSECVDKLAACTTYLERDDVSKCLCDSRWTYYNPIQKECISLTHLKVKNAVVSARTTHSVTFSWDYSFVDIRAVYKLRTSTDNAHTSQIASASGGTYSGLTAGTHYQIYIDTYIPADEFYNAIIASVYMFTIWTFPSQPGLVDLSASQLLTPPMIVIFERASGYVENYKVYMTGPNSYPVATMGGGGDPDITGISLTPGETYTYRITAVNGNGDESHSTRGTFRTSLSGVSFGQACGSSSECKNTLSCINGACTCDSNTQYWDNSQCRLKVTSQSECWLEAACRDSLSCIDNVCACDQKTKFSDGSRCNDRKHIGEACTNMPKECREPYVCLVGTCDCDYDVYYRNGSVCRDKMTFGGKCSTDGECKRTLMCIEGVCGCDSATTYQGESGCDEKKRHKRYCSATWECLDPNAVCVSHHEDEPKACLCQLGYFYSQTTRICQDMDYLKIHTPIVTSRSTKILSFTWGFNSSNVNPFIQYRIKQTPIDGFERSTANGGSLYDLIPGTQYNISVETFLAGDAQDIERVTTVHLGLFWTLPSPPGPIDLARSLLYISPPMTLVFQPSEGNLVYYFTGIVGQDFTVDRRQVYENKILGNWRPGVTYTYYILTANGNLDVSPSIHGSFRIKTTDLVHPPSSPVQELSIQDVTADGATISWRLPSSPNGQIHGFVVHVSQDGGQSCLVTFVLFCSDCGTHNRVPTSIKCSVISTRDDAFAKSQADDTQHIFSFAIPSLAPFTTYSVGVSAVNDAGVGIGDQISVLTSGTAADDITELTVTSLRIDVDGAVSLMASWTPGNQTGETNYTIQLAHSDGEIVTTAVNIGYENTRITFPNMTGYHEYRVMVFAETMFGKGGSATRIITTTTTNPGRVRGLAILPDPVYAARMRLEFQCPSETEWNGVIQGVKVTKQRAENGFQEVYSIGDNLDCSDVISIDSSLLGTFVVNETYRFQMTVQNQDYDSLPSDQIMFYAAPKKPVFERQVLDEDSSSKIAVALNGSGVSVSVLVCTSCLADPIQGEITQAGLIVCVKSNNNSCPTTGDRQKRSVLPETTYLQYPTWAQARQDGYPTPYRTTPDTWLHTMITENRTHYVIGEDNDCPMDTRQLVHCNGPLPVDRQVVFTAVACTVAGCQSQAAEFVIETKASVNDKVDNGDDDGDDEIDDGILGLGIGLEVIVPVCVLVVVIIPVVIVFICYRRRKRDNSGHSDESQHKTNQDNELNDLRHHETRQIKIAEFKETVSVMHKYSDLLFVKEFEDLQTISATFQYPNGPLDRQHREKSDLETPSQNHNLQIGASLIAGLNSEHEYIASGIPESSAVPQFWKMVWEQKCQIIVMLSDLVEGRKTKADPYWPIHMEAVTFGDVTVEVMNSFKLNKVILREFKISVGSVYRHVNHFYIPAWWEADSPLTSTNILDFVQTIRGRKPVGNTAPVIVQCSANEGRTGAFIALLHLTACIDQYDPNHSLNIFQYVLEMRRSKPNMAHNLAQYIFIYDLVSEWIQRRPAKESLYEHLDLYEDLDKPEEEYHRYLKLNPKTGKLKQYNENVPSTNDHSTLSNSAGYLEADSFPFSVNRESYRYLEPVAVDTPAMTDGSGYPDQFGYSEGYSLNDTTSATTSNDRKADCHYPKKKANSFEIDPENDKIHRAVGSDSNSYLEVVDAKKGKVSKTLNSHRNKYLEIVDVKKGKVSETLNSHSNEYLEIVDVKNERVPETLHSDSDSYLEAVDAKNERVPETLHSDSDSYLEAVDAKNERVPETLHSDSDSYLEAVDAKNERVPETLCSDSDSYLEVVDAKNERVPENLHSDSDSYLEVVDAKNERVPETLCSDSDSYLEVDAKNERVPETLCSDSKLSRS